MHFLKFIQTSDSLQNISCLNAAAKRFQTFKHFFKQVFPNVVFSFLFCSSGIGQSESKSVRSRALVVMMVDLSLAQYGRHQEVSGLILAALNLLNFNQRNVRVIRNETKIGELQLRGK